MVESLKFNGFSKAAFDFYKQLSFYQNKEFYDKNKPVYQKEVVLPMGNLITEVACELEELGFQLKGDPKKSQFRIHRDARFSHDKTPYKTHAGATLSRDGRKLSPGMLYIQVSPEESFVAMGTYHPEPEELIAMREAIAKKQKVWLEILKDLKANKLELSPINTLKRMPRGYDSYAETALAESFKQRNFIIRRDLPKSCLGNRKLVTEILKFAKAGRKFLEFQWSAIDHAKK